MRYIVKAGSSIFEIAKRRCIYAGSNTSGRDGEAVEGAD